MLVKEGDECREAFTSGPVYVVVKVKKTTITIRQLYQSDEKTIPLGEFEVRFIIYPREHMQ